MFGVRVAAASVLAAAALLIAGCGDSGTPVLYPTAPAERFNMSKTGGPAGPETCDASNTTVRVSKISRPVNHLMLELTNTGVAFCAAYGYPRLRFDDAQAAAPAFEESRPQSVVEIAPGASAYAAVMTSAANNPSVVPAYRLALFYAERAGDVNPDGSALALPLNTYIGPAVAVTYWQDSFDHAVIW